jgi:hypothetical protein
LGYLLVLIARALCAAAIRNALLQVANRVDISGGLKERSENAGTLISRFL